MSSHLPNERRSTCGPVMSRNAAWSARDAYFRLILSTGVRLSDTRENTATRSRRAFRRLPSTKPSAASMPATSQEIPASVVRTEICSSLGVAESECSMPAAAATACRLRSSLRTAVSRSVTYLWRLNRARS